MRTLQAVRPDSAQPSATDASWSIGRSPVIRALHDAVQRIANATGPVLILGEPGTGKESVARALHRLGNRRHGPFVVIPCAGDSERGPHAAPDVRALAVSATGGTLYIDGIDQLSPTAQGEIVRVIEDHRSEADGASAGNAGVRVIAATPIALDPAVGDGRFREELYRRLSVDVLRVPELRDRQTDIPELVAHALKRRADSPASVKTVAPEAMARLVGYPWPGNLREFDALIARVAAQVPGPVIQATDLPPEMRAGARPEVLAEDVRHGAISLTKAVDAFERELILDALERTSHVQVRAAKHLGITRRILKYKMDLLGIPVKRPRIRTRREAA
ncbi:MAG: sigma-54-dependent transcriptional regulator [Nitrospirota bacterium]